MLEGAVMVKLNEVLVPLVGTLPVPTHPVETYCTPVPPLAGDETDAEIELLALNHPLVGVGEPQLELEPQTEVTVK
jgi:hypothetical protein